MCDGCKFNKDGFCYHPFDWWRQDDNPLGFCNLYEPGEFVPAAGDCDNLE